MDSYKDFLIVLISFAAYCESAFSVTSCTETPDSCTAPYRNFRLPDFVRPNNYDVFLDVDMSEKKVTGRVEIQVSVHKQTRFILIHAFRFTSLKGEIRDENINIVAVKKEFYHTKNQYYVIETIRNMSPGTYFLRYSYAYKLNDNLSGFYHMTYKTKEGKKKEMAATQLCPIDARTVFPCFDEPGMRATFNMTISRDFGYDTISNMPVYKTWHDELKTRQYSKFMRTPRMSTYLLAVVISEFANISQITKTQHSVKMSLFAPQDDIKDLSFAAHTGSQILSFYERFFNVSYPLPKADMIVLPNFSLNGMENWGLIAFSMKSLLFSANMTSLAGKTHVVRLMAHELAHQWFGNLVTISWWSDIWLNEGFATYVQYIGMNSVFPEWKYMELAIFRDMMSAMRLDTLSISHPIHIPVKDTSDIGQVFDPISYQKGACILRMLDNCLGSNNFVTGVIAYLKKYAFKNAKTEDLWNELTEASRQQGDKYDISRIMKNWVQQKGFPVVDVIINTRKQVNEFVLKQSPFSSNNAVETHRRWMIPFDYILIDITNTSQIFKTPVRRIWMNETLASISVDSSDVIIKGNAGQYGYFRVNYDEKDWRKFISILKTKHVVLDATDRAGLLHDSFELARAGILKYSTALDLFAYIDIEREYLPWHVGVESIQQISQFLKGDGRLYGLLQKFIRLKVFKIYEHFGFGEVSDFQNRQLQVLVTTLACKHGYTECRHKVMKMFADWMKTGKTIINDFRELVYFYGVLMGGEAEWKHVFGKYSTSKVPSERGELLQALCATTNPDIVAKLLRYTLNNYLIKSQDVSLVFRYVSERSTENRRHAWNFVTENLKLIVKSFGNQLHTLERILQGVTSQFKTKEELRMAKDYFESKKKLLKQVWGTVKQIKETIQLNVSWMDMSKTQIEDWLKINVKE